MRDAASDSGQHLRHPADIGQAPGRVGLRGAQQHVVRLVLAQDVVDQVGVEGHLAAGFFLSRHAPFDQSGNHRHVAEGPAQHGGFRHPFLQVVAQHVFMKQSIRIGHRFQAPGRQDVVGRDKPERPQSGTLHAPGQQHAERLVRVAPFEAIGDQELLFAARKGLDQEAVGRRHDRRPALQPEPFGHGVGQVAPAMRRLQHGPHPFRQVGRERQAAAHVGRHLRVLAARGAGDLDPGFAQTLEAQQFAGENEGLAGYQAVDEVFLDLAQNPAALELHLDGRRLDDGADIHAVAPQVRQRGDPVAALLVAGEAAVALVAAQGIAAVRDEGEHVVEVTPREPPVRRRADHLAVERVGVERPGAGRAQDMLGQHVEPAGLGRIAVQAAGAHAFKRGAAFQYFETVGRHQQGAARPVKSMVGPADPLQQARYALGRADLHDQIDRGPVDAEVE